MAAAHAGAPLAAHGVDFVNEDNGGGGLLGLVKEVPDPGRAHAHVQLHKVGAGDGEEAHPGLPGHGLGKQGLARARRAHQQHALGDAGPQGDEPPGVPEELHNLLKLFLFLLRPGHVLKADLLVLLREDPGPGGAEAGHAVRPHAAPLAPQQKQVAHAADQRRRQKEGQQNLQPVRRVVLLVVVGGDDPPGGLLLHQLAEAVVKQVEVVELIAQGVPALRLPPQRHQQGVVPDDEGLHLLLAEQLLHLGELHPVSLAVQLPDPAQAQQDHQPQHQKAEVGRTVLLGHDGIPPLDRLRGGAWVVTSRRRPPASARRCRGCSGTSGRNPGRSPPRTRRAP